MNGADNGYYGGGGGRIALYADTIDLSNAITNIGGEDTGASSDDGSAGTIYINATSVITSSGNITATGDEGTTARINVTAPLMTLSGIYNASSNVEPQGIITLDSSNGCLGYDVGNGIFDPAEIYITGDCINIFACLR